jgi:2-polyprenyl-3-methyl-5-hydroxy-6-metoxy-1,4-benzoquinol methylase
MKTEVNNPCCVCGSQESRLLFERTFSGPLNPGPFAIRRCSGCSLLFNSPRLTPEGIRSLYNEQYYFFRREDEPEFERIVNIYQRTVAEIGRDIKPGRILEIGSAKGYLLAVMKALAWQPLGIEVSPEAAHHAAAAFGADCFTGTLEEYVRSPRHASFPLVLAIDLLEHLENPREFMGQLREVVENGGWLIIDTPNGGAYNIAIQGAEWKGFNPFHIFLFTRENLITLLSKNGFEVYRIFSYSNKMATINRTPPAEKESEPASPPPPSSSIKETMKTLLKQAGLFDAVAPLYRQAKRFTESAAASSAISRGTHPPHQLQAHMAGLIDRALVQIKTTPIYSETPDYTYALADQCRGDNLVVFAIKR